MEAKENNPSNQNTGPVLEANSATPKICMAWQLIPQKCITIVTASAATIFDNCRGVSCCGHEHHPVKSCVRSEVDVYSNIMFYNTLEQCHQISAWSPKWTYSQLAPKVPQSEPNMTHSYTSNILLIFLSVEYTLLHTLHCKPLLFDRCQVDNVDNSHRCPIDKQMDGLASSMCFCRYTFRHIQYPADFFLHREYMILLVELVRALAKPQEQQVHLHHEMNYCCCTWHLKSPLPESSA